MRKHRGSSQVFADPEAYWRGQGVGLIAGVDEAGRGPLAGPVVAAAVIVPAGLTLPGLTDSKRLHPENRETLDAEIRTRALAFAVMEVGAREIERLGILTASLKAMALAVKALAVIPEMVLVDGHQPLPLAYPQQPVIKGDDRCPAIAAASVLAKVHRDRRMTAYTASTPSTTSPATRAMPPRNTWRPCSAGGRASSTGAPLRGCGSGWWLENEN
jgi:ribonuclease HII